MPRCTKHGMEARDTQALLDHIRPVGKNKQNLIEGNNSKLSKCINNVNIINTNQ